MGNNVEEDIPVGDLSDNETDNDNPDNVVESVSTLRVIPKISITDYDATEEEQEAKKLKARERVKQTDSSKGMLRSKIECGMGTVPIGNKVHLQTWDGVMSGDRLLTMACSDKILRWNVVGIQGALLTHLIKPVYLSYITVGSKFHPGHMKRALYERIQRQVCDLPRPYNLRIPNLYATTSPETRQATKAHDYSVNWVLDSGQAEIDNGSTGKTISDNTSRLSKQSLFGRFLSVSHRLLDGAGESKSDGIFSRPARYSEVKAMAVDYQEAKAEVAKALVKAGCGHWVEKPLEQDQFSLWRDLKLSTQQTKTEQLSWILLLLLPQIIIICAALAMVLLTWDFTIRRETLFSLCLCSHHLPCLLQNISSQSPKRLSFNAAALGGVCDETFCHFFKILTDDRRSIPPNMLTCLHDKPRKTN